MWGKWADYFHIVTVSVRTAPANQYTALYIAEPFAQSGNTVRPAISKARRCLLPVWLASIRKCLRASELSSLFVILPPLQQSWGARDSGLVERMVP